MARRKHMNAWQYELGGNRYGPVAEEDLLGLISNGTVKSNTPVWRQGLAEWQTADKTELEKYFDASGQATPEVAEKADYLATEAKRRKPQPKAPRGEVKSLKLRGGIFRLCLVGFLITLAALILTLLTPFLLNGDEYETGNALSGTGPAYFATLAWGIASILYIFFYYASALSYCFFFHRAMHNIWAVHNRHADMPAAMVWLWNFVPIANWFKPVDGVSQIWRGSAETAGQTIKLPNTIGLWWICWLLGNLISSVAGLVNSELVVDSLFEYANNNRLYLLEIGALALIGVASFALLNIVNKIMQMQKTLSLANVADDFD